MAKYCNEHVRVSVGVSLCVCVCLSVCLRASPEPHAQSLPFLCMLPIDVARSSSGGVALSKGEGAILGFPLLTMHYSIWDPYENG